VTFRFKHGDRPLEGFCIQRGVGTGGFGEVYYAISDGGKEVALKYLRDRPEVELRGVEQCINLKSPHLVSIFDVRKNQTDEYFIVMEYISGPSLRDLLIAAPNGLGEQKAAYFLREIGKGLAYLHDRGIVHRDLKPGNIFYDDGYTKIGDYGLSKFISISRHSAQTSSVGTVHYMAPEVGSGDYSRGIDIYALGVILYEMLMGNVPFEGSSMGEVLMKHLTAQPEVDSLSEPFAKVIRKALAKDPKDRYQTVDEMLEDVFNVAEVKESLAGFNPRMSLSGAVKNRMHELADPPAPLRASSSSLGIAPVHRDGAIGTRIIQTREELEQVVQRGIGFIYNDFGGTNPKDCPLHTVGCTWISRMLDVKPGPLSVKKVWCDDLSGMLSWLNDNGKLYSFCSFCNPRSAAPSTNFAKGTGKDGVTRPIARVDRTRRMVLCGILAFGASFAVGLFAAILTDGRAPEIVIAASLITLAGAGGVLLSHRLLRWFGPTAEPAWTQRMVTGVVTGLPMVIGSVPAMASRTVGKEGVVILLSLMVVITLGNWKKSLQKGAEGRLRVGDAIGKAVFALWVAAMIGGMLHASRSEWAMFIAAAIAGAISIIVQGSGWWVQPLTESSTESSAEPTALPEAAQVSLRVTRRLRRRDKMQRRADLRARRRLARGLSGAAPAIPFAIPIPEPEPDAPEGSTIPVAPARSGIARAIWSMITFILFISAIMLLIVPIIMSGKVADPSVPIVACIACVTSGLFALSKTTPRKREGYWLETTRPLLMAFLAMVIGVSVTFIVQPRMQIRPYQQNTPQTWVRRYYGPMKAPLHYVQINRPATMPVLVLASAAFAALALRGRKHKSKPKPFVLPDSSPGTPGPLEDEKVQA